MATERKRTIRCKACGHAYEVTRVVTAIEDPAIEGPANIIQEPTLLGTAYCPNCGKRAEVMQPGIDDADG